MDNEKLTILSSVCTFLIAHKDDIMSKVIASATYDSLKTVLDFSSLKENIKGFFKNGEEADNYIKNICNESSKNVKKPYRDIEDKYEELTGEGYNKAIFEEIKKWINENEKQISTISQGDFENKGGITVGTQNAGKNIFNIQGDYKPNKD